MYSSKSAIVINPEDDKKLESLKNRRRNNVLQRCKW